MLKRKLTPLQIVVKDLEKLDKKVLVGIIIGMGVKNNIV